MSTALFRTDGSDCMPRESGALERLYSKSLQGHVPINSMIAITPYCNHRCIMCAFSLPTCSENGANLMSTSDWEHVLTEMRDAGVLRVTLTGGEPTVHPEFPRIYSFAKKQGFIVNIKTNGTFMPPEVKSILEKYPPQDVLITVYGGSPETYERVTGNADGFQQVYETIKFYKSIGSRVVASMTVINQNLRDIFTVAKQVSAHGLILHLNADVFPKSLTESPEETAKYVLTPAVRASLANFAYHSVDELLLQAEELEKELINWRKPELVADDECVNESMIRRYCMNASSGCYINYDGSMQYCATYQAYKVPVRDGFLNGWKNLIQSMDTYFPYLRYCACCPNLSYCSNVCPARFSISGNSFDKPDDRICKFAYLNRIIKEGR